MARIKIDGQLYERVKRVSQRAGYASPEELIVHLIEKELAVLESAQSEEEVTERLRGLGYLE
ncbi:MAG: hypothetical protein V3W34_17695 [Phycisphaerae bacterium]